MLDPIHIINPLRATGGIIGEESIYHRPRKYITCCDGSMDISGATAINEATAVSIWNDKFSSKPRECV